jgi:hypothetical protein
MKRFVILSTLAFVLLFSQTAKADLVVNGGFQGSNGPSTDGWINNCYGVGWGDGNFAAGFGFVPGTLSQTISTVPDAWYTFNFLLLHDSPGGTQELPGLPHYPPTQIFQALWDENLIFTAPVYNFGPGPSNGSSPSFYTWVNFEFTVQASGPSTTIAFAGQDTGGFYFLDNVSVNPVPVPTTMLLLGSGLAGLAGVRRKSRKS